MKKQFSISSKHIGKHNSSEVDDAPNPRLQAHNGENSSKSKILVLCWDFPKIGENLREGGPQLRCSLLL